MKHERDQQQLWDSRRRIDGICIEENGRSAVAVSLSVSPVSQSPIHFKTEDHSSRHPLPPC
jgi:hypothetical protein